MIRPPSHRRLFTELAISSAIGLVLVAFVARREDAVAALITAMAYGAVVAGVAAVRLTWPPFQAWREATLASPAIRLWFEVADSDSTLAQPVRGTGEFRGSGFMVRAVVENYGSAMLRSAVINIIVPATCKIEARDPPPKGHYLSPMSAMSDRFVPGSPTEVRFTAARGDLPPGDHVYHAWIEPLVGMGPWRVMLDVTGDPPEGESGELRADFRRVG